MYSKSSISHLPILSKLSLFPKNVMQWLVYQQSYGVSLEIMPELSCTHNDGVADFLDLRIILFGSS
jgi:hypothetical protein